MMQVRIICLINEKRKLLLSNYWLRLLRYRHQGPPYQQNFLQNFLWCQHSREPRQKQYLFPPWLTASTVHESLFRQAGHTLFKLCIAWSRELDRIRKDFSPRGVQIFVNSNVNLSVNELGNSQHIFACCLRLHSTRKDSSLSFLVLFRVPAIASNPFCIAKGDSFERGASSLADFITRNRGQLAEVTKCSYSESVSESLGDLVRRRLDLVESMLLFS